MKLKTRYVSPLSLVIVVCTKCFRISLGIINYHYYLKYFPPGSKSEALRLGVHLILLYFIRISLSTPKTFFYLVVGLGWAVGGGGCPTFLFFKSLDNNMVYSLGIYVFVYERNPCRTKVLWVLKFAEVGDLTPRKPKSAYVGRFSEI